jgi:hypothetical protein
MQTDRADVNRLPPTARSRVSNGSALLDGIDHRTAEARRYRDVLAAIVSDLGGIDHLSEGQKQMARRAGMLAVQCEKIEAAAVSGAAVDLETYGQLVDRLGRAFGRLGLKRVAKDITPSLDEYLARKRAVASPEAEA